MRKTIHIRMALLVLAGLLFFCLAERPAAAVPIPRYRTVELPKEKEKPITPGQRGEAIGSIISVVVIGGLYLVMRARSGRE